MARGFGARFGAGCAEKRNGAGEFEPGYSRDVAAMISPDVERDVTVLFCALAAVVSLSLGMAQSRFWAQFSQHRDLTGLGVLIILSWAWAGITIAAP